MTEVDPVEPAADPDASPFGAPPVEGIPYDSGSAEEQAIQRVLEDSPPPQAPSRDS